MIINQPQPLKQVPSSLTNLNQIEINMDKDEALKKEKKEKFKQEQNPHEQRIFHYLNMYRNKDITDYHKMNKQTSKNKRKEDRFLADREIEQFESIYSDFSFGQMAMSFPNPDYESTQPQGILFKDAIQIYDDNLNVLNPQIPTSERDFQRKAFLLSFLLLDDFVDNTEEAKIAAEKKQEEEDKKRKKKAKELQQNTKNQTPNNGQIKNNTVEDQQNKILLDRKDSKTKLLDGKNTIELQHYELKQKLKEKKKMGLNALEIIDLIAELRYLEESEIPLVGNLFPGVSEQQGMPSMTHLKEKKEVDNKKDPKGNNNILSTVAQDSQFLISKENKEVQQKQLGVQKGNILKTEENQPQIVLHGESVKNLILQLTSGTMNNDLSSFKMIKKKLNKGKFMYKRTYDQNDFDWVITNHIPKDFQTLIRMTLVSKLSINGKIVTRQILSADGSEIIINIKAPEDIIRSTASYYKLNKQIELGYADILSLEPCDDKYRPLRLKYVLRLAVKNAKKKKDIELDEKTKNQRVSGVLPIRNLREYLSQEEEQFWADLGRKQLYFDGILKDIGQEIRANQDQELVEIIDDNDPLQIKMWSAYSLYLDYMIYYCSKMKALKKFAKEDSKKEQKVENPAPNGQQNVANNKIALNHYEKNAAFLYRLIFKQAIEDTNLYFKKVQSFFKAKKQLKNIWHHLEVETPIPPFSQFTNSSSEEHLLFWRKYEVNEFKYRSIFTNMEKIKICDIIVNDNINTLKLLNQRIMLNYFPLHEPHQLKGEYKLAYFQKAIENDYIPEPELTELEEKIRKLFLMLDSQADPSDFDTESLVSELSVKFFRPWYLQIDAIRDYFGEKIALYFQFLSSYTFHLSYMSIIGIIIEIIIAATKYNHAETAAGFRFLFAVIIIVWQVSFIEFWKRKQALFALTYGQEDFQQSEQERPSFKGSYKRSIADDKVNNQFYPEFKRKIFIFISLLLSLIVISIVIGIIIALFFFKAWLLENNHLTNVPFLNPNALIGILNSIQIIIFNTIYMSMNDWMSEIENHQILQTYENSYISKVFMFTFCNTFNSCFIISFFSDVIYLKKGNTTYIDFCQNTQGNARDCFESLRTQMISIFIINLIKNLPELIVPLLKSFAKKTLRGKQDNLIMHPFREIDNYIKNQFDLEPYTTNREIDGTVSDYMELIIQFCFLSLFGLAFPVSFLLAFVNNVMEIQVDKIKLIYISRRPTPTGASNIGTWFVILEIVSFISIFTNSGLIAFTSDTVTSNSHYANDQGKYEQRIFFVTFLVFLFLKYMVASIIDDVPEQVQIIKKRHKNCINSLLKGLSKTKARSIIGIKPSITIEKVQYPKSQLNRDDEGYAKIQEQEKIIQENASKSLQQKLIASNSYIDQQIKLIQEKSKLKKQERNQIKNKQD